ncbi:toll-interacting protein B [Hydra vulgaris]|uniref:Toll-interacting protein n=1 Tax=Hydra vulgaris TaxID=6087 RepID=T2M581_HYDVU|nr:toll-interacting protein B [Hydra vulgaris]
MASNDEEIIKNQRRQQVLTGELPDNFLKIESGQVFPASGQSLYYPASFGRYQEVGVLSMTVVQARLVKNYGYLTRMDPYCRVRIGLQTFETPTAYNGAKSPRWNKLIQCNLPENVREVYLEMFDECTFSVDERIAWCLIKIPDSVIMGEVLNEWFSLNGKQGEEKEGMIEIVFQYKKLPAGPMLVPSMVGPMVINPMVQPLIYPNAYGPQVIMQQPIQPVQPNFQQSSPGPQQIFESNPADLRTLKEMCPDMDVDIIKTVLQQCGGNIDKAAAQLLEMNAT